MLLVLSEPISVRVRVRVRVRDRDRFLSFYLD
jgi:hypothetical protein